MLSTQRLTARTCDANPNMGDITDPVVELDTARRVVAVRRALGLLPSAHLATLGAIVQHLHQYGGKSPDLSSRASTLLTT